MTSLPTPETLQRHAHDLATAFQVRLIESAQLKPEEALSLPHIRVALTAPISDDTTYLCALHEIGHLASPTGVVRPAAAPGSRLANLLLVEEESAWTWARHYALIWTPAMEAVRTWAFGTYLPRTRPAAAVPEPVSVPMDWTRDDVAPSAAIPPPSINWNDWQ